MIHQKNPINVFISYSTKNSEEGKNIQRIFEECGAYCFLSETTIDPSEEYVNDIINNIKKSQIFIFLLSKEFKESNWCSQEIGMAVMRYNYDKTILLFPLMLDNVNPYGFLTRFNGIYYHDELSIYKIIEKIDTKLNTHLLKNRIKYHENNIDNIIKELHLSKSYNDSYDLLCKLMRFEYLITPKQANSILDAACHNNQIYESFKCDKCMDKFIDKFKNDLNHAKIAKFLSKTEH